MSISWRPYPGPSSTQDARTATSRSPPRRRSTVMHSLQPRAKSSDRASPSCRISSSDFLFPYYHLPPKAFPVPVPRSRKPRKGNGREPGTTAYAFKCVRAFLMGLGPDADLVRHFVGNRGKLCPCAALRLYISASGSDATSAGRFWRNSLFSGARSALQEWHSPS